MSVKHFAFVKFSEATEQCFLLFTLILFMFLVSLTGNALIVLAIWTNPALHTPMYFFLANLSLLEIGYTCSTIPKMLQNLLTEQGSQDSSSENSGQEKQLHLEESILQISWIWT
ncbi:olfactory receptor 7C1-like isoform X2 [Bos indicus x Bos taurus]|uniref:olfactory receptor 7C1-like isoform X2 n=2 Tax=Bos TaxID=9903 RepID=UPI000F7D3CF2|nr:olfactory receptor 7C1-like isoform X2 [Bos indicus x Bos taurus]